MFLSLRFGTREIQLGIGEYLIGRGADCHLVVDDRLASRHHAKLQSSPMHIAIEDLGSSNGTFVNGARLQGSRSLAPGDVIVVGRSEFEVVGPGGAEALHGQGTSRGQAKTPNDGVRPGNAEQQAAFAGESSTTGRKDVLELLAGVARRALGNGNAEQAERVLTPVLAQVLDAVRRGAPPEPAMVEAACGYALELAKATRRERWFDYVVEIWWHLGKPAPRAVVDGMVALGPLLPEVRVELLWAYVERLRADSARLSAQGIFALERLDALARTLAAR